MFHKNVLPSFGSYSTSAPNDSQPTTTRLTLVPAGGGPPQTESARASAAIELLTIAGKKCSSFLAEAAVLVLVFALLDRFMVKDRMEISWVVSAFSISVVLLAGSIAMDFSVRRWAPK